MGFIDYRIINGCKVEENELHTWYLTEYIGKDEEVRVPDCACEISTGAFEGMKSLKKVVVPPGVAAINNRAFKDCENLTEIDLPDSISFIGDKAFAGCERLETIALPGQRLTYIGPEAFEGCVRLKTIRLPEGIEGVYSRTFCGCSALESAYIPDSARTIADEAFMNCTRLAKVRLPQGPLSTGKNVFEGCPQLEGLIDLEKDARLVIPDSVTALAARAYLFNAQLTDVTIPGSVETIGESCFMGCENLRSVVMQDGVREIGAGAFSDCASLGDVALPATLKAVGAQAFRNCGRLESVRLPAGTLEIGAGAFGGCGGLKTVVVPDSVHQIGEGAFPDNKGLVLYGQSPAVQAYARQHGIPVLAEDADAAQRTALEEADARKERNEKYVASLKRQKEWVRKRLLKRLIPTALALLAAIGLTAFARGIGKQSWALGAIWEQGQAVQATVTLPEGNHIYNRLGVTYEADGAAHAATVTVLRSLQDVPLSQKFETAADGTCRAKLCYDPAEPDRFAMQAQFDSIRFVLSLLNPAAVAAQFLAAGMLLWMIAGYLGDRRTLR